MIDLEKIVAEMNKTKCFDGEIDLHLNNNKGFMATISVVEIENAGFQIDNFGYLFDHAQEVLGYNPVFEYESDLEIYDKHGEYISDTGIKHIPYTLILNIYKGE